MKVSILPFILLIALLCFQINYASASVMANLAVSEIEDFQSSLSTQIQEDIWPRSAFYYYLINDENRLARHLDNVDTSIGNLEFILNVTREKLESAYNLYTREYLIQSAEDSTRQCATKFECEFAEMLLGKIYINLEMTDKYLMILHRMNSLDRYISLVWEGYDQLKNSDYKHDLIHDIIEISISRYEHKNFIFSSSLDEAARPSLPALISILYALENERELSKHYQELAEIDIDYFKDPIIRDKSENRLSVLYAKSGNIALSMKYLSQVSSDSYDYPVGIASVVNAFITQGLYDEAIEVIREVKEVDDQSFSLILFISIQDLLNRNEIEESEILLRLCPYKYRAALEILILARQACLNDSNDLFSQVENKIETLDVSLGYFSRDIQLFYIEQLACSGRLRKTLDILQNLDREIDKSQSVLAIYDCLISHLD